MRIILTGGGTLGSVSPLIAIAEYIKKKDSRTEVLWVGTKNGPEQQLIKSYDIAFTSISTGKFRRYLSIKNITDMSRIGLGCIQSMLIIIKFKPHLVIGAGSFVQVPVMWTTRIISPKTKIIIHQQDIKKGLANSLVATTADRITVSVKQSLDYYPKGKAILTGNPHRSDLHTGSIDRAVKFFSLHENTPVILMMGGGTGATGLNHLIMRTLPKLTEKFVVIHITGKNKTGQIPVLEKPNRYHCYEFMTSELKDAYALAEVVVSRAGFSTITELSALAKPAILIPMHGTHQEKNAMFLEKNKAALVLHQKTTTPKKLMTAIEKILENMDLRFSLSVNIRKLMPQNATEKFVDVIKELFDEKFKTHQW